MTAPCAASPWRPRTGCSAARRSPIPAAPSACPSGTKRCGRIFNVLGETVDDMPRSPRPKERWNIHRPAPSFDELSTSTEILETGIKVIDLICPLRQGRQDRPLRRRGRRQDRADYGADSQHRQAARRLSPSSPASASAPVRATTCINEMNESGVINKTALVFGQMNEPPGARMRVALIRPDHGGVLPR